MNEQVENENRYLIGGLGVWGKGSTLIDALSNVPSAETDMSCLQAFEMPEGTTKLYVDDMGSSRWTWDEDAPDRDARSKKVEFGDDFCTDLYYATTRKLSEAVLSIQRLANLRKDWAGRLGELAEEIEAVEDELGKVCSKDE